MTNPTYASWHRDRGPRAGKRPKTNNLETVQRPAWEEIDRNTGLPMAPNESESE